MSIEIAVCRADNLSVNSIASLHKGIWYCACLIYDSPTRTLFCLVSYLKFLISLQLLLSSINAQIKQCNNCKSFNSRLSFSEGSSFIDLRPVYLEGGYHPLSTGTLLPRPVERAKTSTALGTKDLWQQKQENVCIRKQHSISGHKYIILYYYKNTKVK